MNRCASNLRTWAAVLAALASLLAGGSAAAQTIRRGAPSQPSVQLGFNGIVAGSVQLTISGTGPTTLSAASNALSPVHARGTVDFGSFSSLRPNSAGNATAYRIDTGTKGAVVAANLAATLVYNGSTTGSVTVSRAAPAGAAPDVPLANLRVASPSLATWTSGANGSQVPDFGQPGLDVCRAAGDATCLNGKAYLHQVAVFVPDTQVAGPFTTTLIYTGVAP